MTPDEVKLVNATARSAGAVGSNAVVPLVVMDHARYDDTVLDYGAGPAAQHTVMLRDSGLEVTAYDIGSNVAELHDPDALKRLYDIVMASNVLNIQPSLETLRDTIDELVRSCLTKGRVICNYPQSPRKLTLSPAEIAWEFIKRGCAVRLVDGQNPASPVLECRRY